MAGDKTYISDNQGKLHRATRVHAVTPTQIVWSSNPNDYTVQVMVGGKWHRAVLTLDANAASYFDNINIDKALVVGDDGKQHSALIVKPETTVNLSSIKTDIHGTVDGTTTGETAVSTYSEPWSNVQWQDNINVYKVLVTGSDGKVHTALLTTGAGGGSVDVIVLGKSPLSLDDAIADSLQYVKAFGGTEQRNIPQPYTQVNYVTNTASTAVDTGIMIDFAKNYEFEVECRAVSGSWYILQSRASSSGNITGIHGATSGSTITLVVGNVTVCTSAITRTVGNKLYVKATLNAGTATLYVKDETAGTEDTQTGSYGTSQPNPTASVYLLGNAGGQYVDVNSDIYMARIKENDTVVMDYVPARQVATAGFYDTASGTFKTALTPANLSADGNTVPTPDTPMDIVSNNGAIKYSANLCDVIPDNIMVGKYISGQGVLVDSDFNFTYIKYIPVKPNTKYTLSLSGAVYFMSVSEYSSADDTGFIIRRTKYSTSPTPPFDLTYLTFTTGATTNYIRWDANIYRTQAITLNDVLAINWMFNNGDSMPYQPYVEGGIYADGAVETINVHGKNLLDVSQDIIYRDTNYTDLIHSNGEISYTNTSTVPFSQYIGVYFVATVGKEYTISFTQTGAIVKVFESDVIKTTVGTDYGNTITSGYTFTATKKYVYIYVIVANGTTGGATNLQIEQGSTATTYEPYYDGGTATAEMLLSLGDYTDEQEIISGVVTRKLGVKVLDGTETWTTSSSGLAYTSKNTVGMSNALNDGEMLSTHFINAGWTSSKTINNGMFVTNGFLGFSRSAIGSTSAEIDDWLADQYAAGTPVIIVYPLAEPTTDTVTGQPMNTTAGDNTLEITQASLSGLELEAKYKKSA